MIFDSNGSLLPGLLPAVYRGITFHMHDTSSDSGRRVVEYLFPGVDAAAYDDFGRAPGIVSIEGFIVGDSYRTKARALEAAFNRPGPGTLIHPWLGPMTVILEDTAQIHFSDRELRIARISASFKRVQRGLSGSLSGGLNLGGFAGLFAAISTLVSLASMLAGGLDRSVISATRGKAVTRGMRIINAVAGEIAAPSTTGRFVPRLRAMIAAASPVTAGEFDALMVAVAEQFAQAEPTPAVAPAAEAVVTPSPKPQHLMTMALTLSETLTAKAIAAPAQADRALLLSATAHLLAQSAALSPYAHYTSRREALAFRARVVAMADQLSDALDGLAGSPFETNAQELRRATRSFAAAVIADINETIGRLPNVLTFQPERPLDAFALAAHVYGDRPELIEAAYRDIVARNNPRHPSILDNTRIEVLER
ncbi:DNA circularization N-terminal domain-containing protein [Rhizobium sp. CFBP 8762]|uniref:DNA circularization N-terminal domain-containing protein n=1 Tax=Rhizobium sp. CFBP 8762 TaxID=2775279 RepID=UPI0017806740|nr:DNA circularization N-terminal domain-containing protein [Rhizobium sp. CFBP 8762]MBD8554922.1 DNA circularization N-terminal domain-containing protein [Rhizobium sp. CFBP 8762]